LHRKFLPNVESEGLVGVCELDSFSSRQAGAVGTAEGSMMRRGKRGIAI
jgi:hypothetical protein